MWLNRGRALKTYTLQSSSQNCDAEEDNRVLVHASSQPRKYEEVGGWMSTEKQNLHQWYQERLTRIVNAMADT